MLEWLFKKDELPCKYGEWKNSYGYLIRKCDKCGGRQVKGDELYESFCRELQRNTFYDHEKGN